MNYYSNHIVSICLEGSTSIVAGLQTSGGGGGGSVKN